MDRQALKKELLGQDQKFRQLFEEHQEYERRLTELTQKSLLSQDDEMEEKRIKVHKLYLKDQMEARLRLEEQRLSA